MSRRIAFGSATAYAPTIRPRTSASATAASPVAREPAQDDLVAVLEERALAPAGEREGLGAVPRQLEQAAALLALGARDRPRAEQVAGAHRGAVDGQVGDLLGDAPVQVARVGLRHALAVELDLERDVERPRLLAQVRGGRRVLRLERRGAERRERRHRRHPRRDRRRERLAEERPERLGLERLQVARAPVVEQHDAEDVVERARRRARARPSRSACRSTKPSSSSTSSFALGPNTGGASRSGRLWPRGRRTGVPPATTVAERPW